MRKNGATLGENAGALDDMLQLPHISRPGILFQQPDSFRRKARVAVVELSQEVARQGFDVLATLGERRQLDGENRKPVEQVFAEMFALRQPGASTATGGEEHTT